MIKLIANILTVLGITMLQTGDTLKPQPVNIQAELFVADAGSLLYTRGYVLNLKNPDGTYSCVLNGSPQDLATLGGLLNAVLTTDLRLIVFDNKLNKLYDIDLQKLNITSPEYISFIGSAEIAVFDAFEKKFEFVTIPNPLGNRKSIRFNADICDFAVGNDKIYALSSGKLTIIDIVSGITQQFNAPECTGISISAGNILLCCGNCLKIIGNGKTTCYQLDKTYRTVGGILQNKVVLQNTAGRLYFLSLPAANGTTGQARSNQ